jgi:hypothetical protein
VTKFTLNIVECFFCYLGSFKQASIAHVCLITVV